MKLLAIQFTGIRKGEKLKEDLYFSNEDTIKTHISKILVNKDTCNINNNIPTIIENLNQSIQDNNMSESFILLDSILNS